MDSFEYEKFSPANLETIHKGRGLTIRGVSRRKLITVGVMYGILLLLVLILLLLTEVKFSQLSGQMKDMKRLLDSNKSPLSSEALSLKGAEEKVLTNDKWIRHKGSSYLLTTFKLTWHNSEMFCLREGGHLLTINTAEEQKYINSVQRPDNYWIGLIERENEGEWSWVDGTDFSSTPHFWAENQPDEWRLAADGEDCGEIIPRGLWNDAQCSLHHNFICEKEEV
ncbi:asialoglycoprotein receptor-like 1 isoform X1 [Scleropages formosus]|uniref:asialoglycoprotein receptor-like 1 isoform X1 n=1 Tax=Scleropages formosus TaxID=113540 RepID=UPI0008786C1E|nr:hepatic lectin-like isoform X1 [Scleropages formosus]